MRLFAPAAAALLAICATLAAEPVASDRPAIRPDEGLRHLRWQDARQAVGENALISGKIVNVGSAGRVNFLNFDRERPARFTGIVFREQLDRFPDLKQTYEGKIVRLRGRVTLYKDRPQIVLTRPEQIEILDELPVIVDEPQSQGRRPEVDGQLRIATYNVLNLFDDQDDAYHDDESTPAKSRGQLTRLARSLYALNADVVALEEVENRGYLERFVDVFLPDLGYDEIVHFEGNDVRGIDVCLLSRVPIGPVRSYRHMTFAGPDGAPRRFRRDVLAATVEPPDAEPFEVWVVHLKSNAGGRELAEPIRLAEARALRDLLDRRFARDPDARVIVLGDFNDVWNSPTLETIVGGGATKLWSAASDVQGDPPDTYNKGEHRAMIDFILCSPAMAKQYVKGSFRVTPGSPELTGSDHNPVSATFRIE